MAPCFAPTRRGTGLPATFPGSLTATRDAGPLCAVLPSVLPRRVRFDWTCTKLFPTLKAPVGFNVAEQSIWVLEPLSAGPRGGHGPGVGTLCPVASGWAPAPRSPWLLPSGWSRLPSWESSGPHRMLVRIVSEPGLGPWVSGGVRHHHPETQQSQACGLTPGPMGGVLGDGTELVPPRATRLGWSVRTARGCRVPGPQGESGMSLGALTRAGETPPSVPGGGRSRRRRRSSEAADWRQVGLTVCPP